LLRTAEFILFFISSILRLIYKARSYLTSSSCPPPLLIELLLDPSPSGWISWNRSFSLLILS
jgi:hypothetical protein